MVMRIQSVQAKKAGVLAKCRIRRNRSLIVVLLLCAVIGYWDQNGGIAKEEMPISGQIIRVYNVETKH